MLASKLRLQLTDLFLGSRQVTGCPATLLLQLMCPICSYLQLTQSYEQCRIQKGLTSPSTKGILLLLKVTQGVALQRGRWSAGPTVASSWWAARRDATCLEVATSASCWTCWADFISSARRDATCLEVASSASCWTCWADIISSACTTHSNLVHMLCSFQIVTAANIKTYCRHEAFCTHNICFMAHVKLDATKYQSVKSIGPYASKP